MKSRAAFHFGLRVAACLVLVACGSKVPMPTSDSTPPTLTWTVLNQTTKVSVNVSPGGSVHAKGTDSLFITLKAQDPEGVAYIELGGGYLKACVGSDGTGTNSQGLFASQSQTFGPDSNNQVSTLAFATKTVQADTTCSGGDQWNSTLVTLNGVARNFFSGKSRGTLSITFVP